EHAAETFRIDARLDPFEVLRLEQLGADAKRALKRERFRQGRPHRRTNPDESAAAHVARLPADSVGGILKDVQRGGGHLRRLGGGIELANDADGAAGASRPEKVALEDEDVSDAQLEQVKGGRDAGDTAADDDDVSCSHGDSFNSLTGSSRRMTPSLSTR